MATTSLADVDPVFVEVAKALYGDGVDARQLWDFSKAMDSADVHVNTAGAPAKPKKKKPPATPPQAGHSNVGRALLLGAAAEGAATFRAGQEATRVLRTPAALRTVSGATKVGEFGLQAGNLGVGLLAAHKLNQHAKSKDTIAKGWFRPAKVVMTDAQRAAHTQALSRAARQGDNVVRGAVLGGAVLVAHRTGKRKGAKLAAGIPDADPIAKGMLVPRTPIAGVKAANAGGLSRGLGRHGRVIGGKTPAPHIAPVARKLPVAKSLTWTGEISKVDEDKRTVFGWCSLSEINGEPVVDLQGDWVPLEEVEKSAYRYVIESRKGGDMHKRVSKTDLGRDEPLHTADLIESFVVTPDKLEQMGLAPDALPLGWWIGMKVNDDDQWSKVKSKERLGFSIHGTGARKDMAA